MYFFGSIFSIGIFAYCFIQFSKIKYSLSPLNRHPNQTKFFHQTNKFMLILRCDRNFRYSGYNITCSRRWQKIETLEPRAQPIGKFNISMYQYLHIHRSLPAALLYRYTLYVCGVCVEEQKKNEMNRNNNVNSRYWIRCISQTQSFPLCSCLICFITAKC